MKAIKLYESNKDVTIILMDGYLYEDNEEEDTAPLTELIRDTYTGIMIAISGSDSMNNKLLKAGCNYPCVKSHHFNLEELLQKLTNEGKI